MTQRRWKSSPAIKVSCTTTFRCRCGRRRQTRRRPIRTYTHALFVAAERRFKYTSTCKTPLDAPAASRGERHVLHNAALTHLLSPPAAHLHALPLPQTPQETLSFSQRIGFSCSCLRPLLPRFNRLALGITCSRVHEQGDNQTVEACKTSSSATRTSSPAPEV